PRHAPHAAAARRRAERVARGQRAPRREGQARAVRLQRRRPRADPPVAPPPQRGEPRVRSRSARRRADRGRAAGRPRRGHRGNARRARQSFFGTLICPVSAVATSVGTADASPPERSGSVLASTSTFTASAFASFFAAFFAGFVDFGARSF